MKLVIFIALIGFVAVTPIENQTPAEDAKPDNDNATKVEKPEEKIDQEQKGLQWPLPDPDNEGDLMLHGSYLFNYVRGLYRKQLEKREDRMIRSYGRDYLQLVYEYIENLNDFTISPILRRDSAGFRLQRRWEKRSSSTKQSQWLSPFTYPSVPQKHIQTQVAHYVPIKDRPTFYNITQKFNQRVFDNFVRLLMKKYYGQEKLEKEEIDYLNRWFSDESIHYGMMSIYCQEGKHVKEMASRIRNLIDENP